MSEQNEDQSTEETPDETQDAAPDESQDTVGAIAAPRPAAADQPQQAVAQPPQQAQTAQQQDLNPKQRADQMNADQAQFADDLRFNRIHPKTYSYMMSHNSDGTEKGTLGKVKTLFGLILAGAGAGILGKNNPVLDMWDKQISNDVDAQKSDQSNKQNWYKAVVEHDKAQSEIGLQSAQTEGVGYENMSKAEKADYDRWKNGQIGIKDMFNTVKAHNYSSLASLNLMQHQIDVMAEGPLKVSAQQKMDQEIVPFFMSKITGRNNDAANRAGLVDKLNPKPPPPPAPKKNAQTSNNSDAQYQYTPTVNVEQVKNAKRLGQESPWAKGAMDPADADKAIEEAGNNDQIRKGGKRWEQAYNELKAMPHAGESMLGAGSTIAGHVAGWLPWVNASSAEAGGSEASSRFNRKRDAIMEGLMSSLPAGTLEERKALLDAYLPKWGDDEATDKITFGGGSKHFRDLEKTPTLDQYPQFKKSAQTYELHQAPKGDPGKVKVENGHVVGKSGKVYR